MGQRFFFSCLNETRPTNHVLAYTNLLRGTVEGATTEPRGEKQVGPNDATRGQYSYTLVLRGHYTMFTWPLVFDEE